MNTIYTPSPGYALTSPPRPRPSTNDLTLIVLHTAIRLSGLFANFTAQRWGLRPLADAAERVAVELIARAVETTGKPDPYPRYWELGELHIIGIRMNYKGNGLVVEVWDSDSTPPPDAYLDHHLSTVADISRQWSCYQPDGGGKVIWAELAMPQQPQARPAATSTNRRYSYPAPETPVEPVCDVPLMRRGAYAMDCTDSTPAGTAAPIARGLGRPVSENMTWGRYLRGTTTHDSF